MSATAVRPATHFATGQAPPSPPGGALAHSLAMGYGEQTLLERCQRRYGDVFMIRVWPFERLVVVADPAEVKRIFRGDATLLHAGEGNKILEPLVGLESVLLLDESDHMHQRKLMLPSFHGDRMRLYGDLMEEITLEEIDRWPLGEAFELHGPMQAITLRVIMRAVFGIEDTGRLKRLERLLMRMLDLGQATMMVPFLQHDLGTRSPWGRFTAVRAAADEMMFAEIRERRGSPGLEERSDVLSLLMQARDEDGQPMSDRALRDELVTLLVAGYETTATQLAWTFERLLRHPRVLDRLLAEIASGDDGYLDVVIKESQRSRPVLTYAMRKVVEPMQVGGYRVDAGATLGASAWLLHHRPEIYPDPYTFRPERFEERPPETYTWTPFGGGVRRCLGAAFATYEMKVVLRTVLGRCRLEAPDPKPEALRRRMITFVPAKGARAVLRPSAAS